jgi:hypothetical protein
VKTILLLSDGDDLSSHIAGSLDTDERLVIDHFGVLQLGRRVSNDDCLVVADIRQGQSVAILQEIERLRMATPEELRCVFISDMHALRTPRLLGSVGGLAADVVFANVEPIGLLVRAYLNDPARGLASAIALTMLLEHLPTAAQPMLNALLGSGFAASSVKECASRARRERSALTRMLHPSESHVSPRVVVDLARASYAVVHISASRCSIGVAAKAVRFASRRSLKDLLMRVFEITPEQILESRTDAPVLLRRLLNARR